MLKTPLYDCHVKANARMVDFSGWSMPINYGSQIQEHQYVRKNCGIFDVSHMLAVDISGAQATEFLRKILANDVKKLEASHAQYGCMLNHDACIIDDLITYKIDNENYRIVVNAGNRESDVAWFRENAKGFDVTITPREELAIIAIQGPNTQNVMTEILGEKTEGVTELKPFSFVKCDDWMFARTGYTGEDGFEVMLPADKAVEFWEKLLNANAEPVGLGARDTLRLEAGMHLYGQDMNTKTTPLDRGLGWSVDLSDENRNFNGKKTFVAKKTQGINTKWVGVVLKSKGVLRANQEIVCDDGQKGVITSGTFSPTLKVAIGLAYISKECANPRVNIRGKELELELTKARFVKNGKSLL